MIYQNALTTGVGQHFRWWLIEPTKGAEMAFLVLQCNSKKGFVKYYKGIKKPASYMTLLKGVEAWAPKTCDITLHNSIGKVPPELQKRGWKNGVLLGDFKSLEVWAF